MPGDEQKKEAEQANESHERLIPLAIVTVLAINRQEILLLYDCALAHVRFMGR